MSLETATYVSQLAVTNPTSSDPKSQGDDHLRLLKEVLQFTFPNASRAFYFKNIVAAKTANYTLLAPDDAGKMVPGDATSGAFTFTLPSSGLYDGLDYTIVKSDFGAAALTINGNGKTINGLSTALLTKPFQKIYLVYSSILAAWIADLDIVVPVGTFIDNGSATTPDGYVRCDGSTTVGNAASTATVAAVYTQQLFLHLWNSYVDATAPVAGGRGANAAADYAANKKITLPDLRGRARFGVDTMGTAANRITTAGSSIDATVSGSFGGQQNQTLTQANLPNATLSFTSNATDPGAHTFPGATQKFINNAGGQDAYIPTGGLITTTPPAAHTHTGNTSSINGNVTQTAVISMPPAFTAYVYMAL